MFILVDYIFPIVRPLLNTLLDCLQAFDGFVELKIGQVI